jgi:hypothetical protein
MQIVQNLLPLVSDDPRRAFCYGVAQGIGIKPGAALRCRRKKLFVASRSRVNAQKPGADAVAHLRPNDGLESFRIGSGKLPLLSRDRAGNAQACSNRPSAR